jgi:hypothetical protein
MIHSFPYRVNPEKACEACVFGSGKHEAWCENAPGRPQRVDSQIHLICKTCVAAFSQIGGSPSTVATCDVCGADRVQCIVVEQKSQPYYVYPSKMFQTKHQS